MHTCFPFFRSARLAAAACALGFAAWSAWADDPVVMAHFRFDSSAPLVNSGASSKALQFTGTGGVEFRDGCAVFDGSLGAGQLLLSGFYPTTVSGISPLYQMTIECFVRKSAFAHMAAMGVLSYGYSSSTDYAPLYMGGLAAPSPRGLYTKNRKGEVDTTWDDFNENDGVWHHVALVLDYSEQTTNTATLYVDGVAQTNTVFGSGANKWTSIPDNYSLYIGNDNSTVPFLGWIDDVRLTAAALTPDKFLAQRSADAETVPSGYSSWTGGPTGSWSEAANWTNGVVPAAGDKVYIGMDANVTLSETTPRLGALELHGTLSMEGWETKLDADTVMIDTNGVLTCKGPYNDTTDASNRVWVACGDLTVCSGGAIDVGSKGYRGSREVGQYSRKVGCGPGKGAASTYVSHVSHGGAGCMATISPAPYGDAVEPQTPGSGGGGYTAARGCDGGGVVRIDATNRVHVDGSICAAGGGVVRSNPNLNVNLGETACGSAGSILVNCAALTGSGTIDAKGTFAYGYDDRTSPAAGGRIALHYDPEAQAAAMEDYHLVVTAAAGCFSRRYNDSSARGQNRVDYVIDTFRTNIWPLTSTQVDYFCTAHPTPGTIWLQDDLFLKADPGRITGCILNVSSFTVDHDFALTNWLAFGEDGFAFTVNGNLSITGVAGRLDLGTVALKTGIGNRHRWLSTIPATLTVTGDLTLVDYGRLEVSAASTNDSIPYGALIDVGGTFHIGSNAMAVAYSNPTNGGSAFVKIKDLVIDERGILGSLGAGFSGGRGYRGYGPGGGYGVNSAYFSAASYGGKGGAWTNIVPVPDVYGDPWRPDLPGSGGGNFENRWGFSDGGGLVRVLAKNEIRVNGRVIADGQPLYADQYGKCGASGGAIWLWCKTFTGSGRLDARGADDLTSKKDYAKTAAGGGGRIAVWTGFPDPDTLNTRRIVPAAGQPATFTGICSAVGGIDYTLTSDGTGTMGYDGEDGTISFLNVLAAPQTIIMLR